MPEATTFETLKLRFLPKALQKTTILKPSFNIEQGNIIAVSV